MRAAFFVAALFAVIAIAIVLRRDDPVVTPVPAGLPPAPVVDQAGMPGQPPCAAGQNTSPATVSAEPVDTTALGDAAPAPYELGAPTAGGRPRGVMMVVHGGAWVLSGSPMLSHVRPVADLWRSKGWATANVDYRPCGFSLQDTLQQYDLVRAKVGPATPICLDGESAGGHLALMVAALRPDVACVIGRAAPTNGETLPSQDATDPITGAVSRVAPQQLAVGMARAFGQSAVRAFSPTTYAGSIKARLLLASVANDAIVPPAQATELAAAITAARPDAYVRVLAMGAGPKTWVHGSTNDADLQAFAAAQDELVSPWTTGPPSAPLHVDGWW